ncbi:MAG: transcription antitermination factor NusB [Candidatus Omnitrophica bacterium]|nr:transcription antitermination factor NusB [Candidatus Omnitrophota bacterium]MBU4303470.1 transcription antitermination factor NusB [Candidatus Omnitrophota bacterium]MBU4467469.1 transcription antitermination factor NusB [Candidatus Omnitrophota bacterium]MCG2708564.1 transcription antitermination factor NusB [Candidatus Omnitrophota bacterium]
MRKRTKAREYVLQMLYQVDITHGDWQEILENFCASNDRQDLSGELKDFSAQLLGGVIEHLEEIDKKISKYAANWQLERMAFVDRNIMRLGCFELLFRADIPPKVAINEAVELAKKYSGLESGKFVNAILDQVKIEKEK